MPPGQSKVELYAALRRDAREGMSNRALERKYRVGWRTVQKALSSAWPQPREPYAPRRSKLDPFKPVIDQMLLADLDAPRKQRHTVVRIYRRLTNEHAMDDVFYQVVRAYVAKRKPEIRVEAGRGPAQVFIEQSHLAGAEAEVDLGEVAVRLRGELVKCHLFCLRLSFPGKAVHRVFASGGQEAFFEGHEHAFRVLGGYVGDDFSAISCSRSGWLLPSRSSDGLAAAVGTTCRCRGESRGIASRDRTPPDRSADEVQRSRSLTMRPAY